MKTTLSYSVVKSIVSVLMLGSLMNGNANSNSRFNLNMSGGKNFQKFGEPVLQTLKKPELFNNYRNCFNYIDYTTEVNNGIMVNNISAVDLRISQNDQYQGERNISDVKDNNSSLDGETATIIDPPLRFIYKIQLFALSKSIPTDATVFKKFEEVSEYMQNNQYKYTLGEFGSMEEARDILSTVKEKGFTDAFIVVFVNDYRLTLRDYVSR